MPKPQILSGARGEILINNKQYALVTNITISRVFNQIPIHTIGAIHARSVEPMSSAVNVTLGRIFPINKPDGSPADGTAIASDIEPVIVDLIKADDITVVIRDKQTGQKIADVKRCRFNGRTTSVAAQQPATEQIRLIGLYDAGPDVDGQAENTPDRIGFE